MQAHFGSASKIFGTAACGNPAQRQRRAANHKNFSPLPSHWATPFICEKICVKPDAQIERWQRPFASSANNYAAENKALEFCVIGACVSSGAKNKQR
jgi:hypothetical protein